MWRLVDLRDPAADVKSGGRVVEVLQARESIGDKRLGIPTSDVAIAFVLRKHGGKGMERNSVRES